MTKQLGLLPFQELKAGFEDCRSRRQKQNNGKWVHVARRKKKKMDVMSCHTVKFLFRINGMFDISTGANNNQPETNSNIGDTVTSSQSIHLM